MKSILHIFIYIIALFITFPMIATWLVYIASKKICDHTWKAIHISVHWTTLFYLLSVLMLFKMFYDRSFIAIIGISLIVILAIILVVQRKRYEDLFLKRGIKLLWRLSFLMFSCLYIIFIILGICKRIF